jgi:hypothetical protein
MNHSQNKSLNLAVTWVSKALNGFGETELNLMKLALTGIEPDTEVTVQMWSRGPDEVFDSDIEEDERVIICMKRELESDDCEKIERFNAMADKFEFDINGLGFTARRVKANVQDLMTMH